MRTFVPSINATVSQLCRLIRPSNSPSYVQIKPDRTAKPQDCFVNVSKKIAAEGGRMQYGWAIWQCDRYYLEAEHHAVYEPTSGPPWVDVTPHLLPTIDRILFLPDDDAIFNPEQLRDNVRMPLLDDKRIKEFFNLSSERTAILNSVPGIGAVTISVPQAQRLLLIDQRKQTLLTQLQRDYEKKVGRNDPCSCGSGKKFKKCCGTAT